jgi:hypothetical protein
MRLCEDVAAEGSVHVGQTGEPGIVVGVPVSVMAVVGWKGGDFETHGPVQPTTDTTDTGAIGNPTGPLAAMNNLDTHMLQ